MTKKQIPTLVGALVTNQEAFAGLPTDDAQWVILNPLEAVAIMVAAIKNRTKEASATVVQAVGKLLEFITNVVIPATDKPFVAGDYFTRPRFYLGSNFETWFLRKTEAPHGGTSLRQHKLKKRSVDAPIIAECGGEAQAETTLAEMAHLMDRQKNGEQGVLLTNGWASIFYIRDVNGVLRTVFVRWYGGQWFVHARPVEVPDRWDDGDQVFSRNSVVSAT